MKTGYTSGDWRVQRRAFAHHGLTIHGPGENNLICHMNPALLDESANAHLIAAAPDLATELERTTALALELMDRAARIDRKLVLSRSGKEPDCELGEVMRLRAQIGRNRKAFAKAGLEEFDALGGPF